MTEEYDKFKTTSKRDYEDMQNNLKEKHTLEIDSLNVKHDVAKAELNHTARSEKEIIKVELEKKIRMQDD